MGYDFKNHSIKTNNFSIANYVKISLNMNKYWGYLLLAIPASLCFPTFVRANEVSRDATGLVPVNNQIITSEQKVFSDFSDFLLSQNVDTENSAKRPETNYWYLSGSVGASFPSDLTVKQEGESASIAANTAFQGNVAVGYQWEQVRAEFELGYGSYGVNNITYAGTTLPLSGDVSATTVFVNGYWDIPTGSKWRPYIGAGVGLGFPNSGALKSDDITGVQSGSGTALALQGKVGLEYEIAKKGNVFLEVKYQNIGGFSTGSGEDKVSFDAIDSFAGSIGYRQGF
jgi:opacity protein-like surface antigen